MTTPTLRTDRIDSMRTSVMHAVDADIQRRGRRTRTTIGLTVASVVVLGAGAIGVASLGDDPSTDFAGSSPASIPADNDLGAAPGPATPEGVTAPESALEMDGTASKSVDAVEDRSVITTGQIRITVKDPRASAQTLSTWIESTGGRVDSRAENGSGDNASAVLTVRVPSDQITATIDRLGDYGSVDSVTLRNDDVTSQAQDLDARIGALTLSIDRLEKIMTDADSSTELIKAEAALTQRQEQLESLQAQRKRIADQVALSTLSIELIQKPRVDSVEPDGFTGGLRDGWNGLVSTVNNVVEAVGRALPWVVIGFVLLGAARFAIGRRRRSEPAPASDDRN